MNYKRENDIIFLRLEKGEEITESIYKLIEKENIKSGLVSCIGACDHLTIGNFDLSTKVYHKSEMTGNFEILSLAGNISAMDNKPYLHLHISVADPKMQAWGGHLNAAFISATAEIIIQIFTSSISRFKDKNTGLNLWHV